MVRSSTEESKLFYGWFVTGASLCITSTAFGILYSFGVFFKPWLSEWSMSRAFLSGVFSLTFLIYGISSFVMGFLSDRYGPRRTLAFGGLMMGTGCILTALNQTGWLIYFTWGIMVGIGVGTAYAPTVATVPKWFVRQKGLAMGIVVSGIGLGVLVFSPLCEFLIGKLGWRSAVVLLGFVIWIVYLGGAFVIRRDPGELGLKPLGLNSTDSYQAEDQEKEASEHSASVKPFQSFNLAQAIRTRTFWILFFVYGFWVLGITIPIVHLVPYATDMGLAAKRAASMQALLGGMSILGRVSLGVLTERMGPKVSLIGLLWFQMLTMLWLIVSHSEWMLWVFTTLFGFSYGGVASVFPSMTEELFGLKALGAIFGLILLGATLGGTIGPTLAGFIFDSTQGYWGGFLAGSLSMAVGVMVSLFIPRRD